MNRRERANCWAWLCFGLLCLKAIFFDLLMMGHVAGGSTAIAQLLLSGAGIAGCIVVIRRTAHPSPEELNGPPLIPAARSRRWYEEDPWCAGLGAAFAVVFIFFGSSSVLIKVVLSSLAIGQLLRLAWLWWRSRSRPKSSAT